MKISVSSNWIIHDSAFRHYLHQTYGTTFDTDIVTAIDCDGWGISTLEGIEYFPNLELLYCSGNNLTSLDVSHNFKLKTLYCMGNSLKSLNVSNTTELVSLHCCENDLTELNIDDCINLQHLICGNNAHLHINDFCGTMIRKNIYGTGIRVLNTSNNRKLRRLHCSDNELTSLDFSQNSQLEYLFCDNNLITELDISKTKMNQYRPNVIDSSKYPLSCKMDSLKTLYLKCGWMLKGINTDLYEYPNCIARHTAIKYKY